MTERLHVRTVKKVFADIKDGKEIPTTPAVKAALHFLLSHGAITITPETTPVIRATEFGLRMEI